MFKNKKVFFIGIVLVLLSLIILYNPVKKIITRTSTFYDGDELVEKNINEIYDTMYATLLDYKAVVVSTTNPDSTVASQYAFTSTTPPQQVFAPGSTGFILMEFENLNGDKSELISSDVIYRLELPEYVKPTSFYTETQSDQCTIFYQKGEAYACGGVYRENTKYVFKIKYRDTEGKVDVRTTYQFKFTLDTSLKLKTVNITNLIFEQYTPLPVYFQKPAANESDDYSVFVEGSSDSYSEYTTYHVTVRNNLKDGSPFTGYLEIDLGDYLGVIFDDGNMIAPIAVDSSYYSYDAYNGACGEGNSDFCFSGDPGYYSVKYSEIEGTKIDATHSGIANKLIIHLGQDSSLNIGQNITTTEVKFEITVSSYFVSSGVSNIVFKYHDNYRNKDYTESVVYDYSINYYAPSFSYQVSNSNNFGVPKKISYTIYDYAYNSNFIQITDTLVPPSASELNGKTHLYHYVPSALFMCKEGGETLKVKINNNIVTFNNCHHSLTDLLNDNIIIYEQIRVSDPQLFNQLKNSPNSDFEIIVGDDNYHYIVLTYDTYMNMYPDGLHPYSDYENNLYLNNELNSRNPGNFSFRLYNVREQDVTFTFDYYLEDAYADYEDTKYVDKHMYTVTNGGYTYTSTLNPNTSLNSLKLYPYVVSSERLNDGYFKWNFEVDETLFGLNTDDYKTLFEDAYIIMDFPINLALDNNILYDGTKVIKNSPGDHGVLYANNTLVNSSIGMDSLITSDLLDEYNLSDNPMVIKASLQDLIDSDEHIRFSLITTTTNVEVSTNISIRPIIALSSKSLISHTINPLNSEKVGDSKITHAFGGSAVFVHPVLNVYEVNTEYKNGKVYKYWDVGMSSTGANYSGELAFGTTTTETGTDKVKIKNNTKLAGIKILQFVDNNVYSSSEFIPLSDFTNVNDEELKYCFDVYHCFYVNYKESNLFFERSYRITGANKLTSFKVFLVSETDLEAIELSGTELNSLDVQMTMDVFSRINNISFSDNKVLATTYVLSAELYIEKSTLYSTDLTYSNTVSAIVGKSATKDLYVIDFIDGYDKGSRNSNNRVVFNNLETDYDKITSLRKAFRVNGVTISIRTGENDEQVIYEDEAFIDAYSNSTFNITSNDARLYTLHLVKNDGSSLPRYTTVTISYSLDIVTEGSNSIRNNSIYNGDKIKITTNAKAIRGYGGEANVPSSELDVHNENIDGTYTNKVDNTNHLLICYASTDLGMIETTYLSTPVLGKSISGNKWTVTYNAGTSGKSSGVNISLDDALTPVVVTNTTQTVEIQKIMMQNIKLSNLEVYYYNPDGDRTTVYTGTGIWDTVNINNVVSGTIKNTTTVSDDDNKILIDIDVDSLEHNSKLQIVYDMVIDYEKMYNQLISSNITNASLQLTDNGRTLSIRYMNVVDDNAGDVEGSGASASSSSISLTGYLPTVTKSARNNGTKTDWTVNFKTGTVNDQITIEDAYTFGKTSSSSLPDEDLEDIKNKTSLKNIVIKVNNVEIYNSGTISDEWRDNVTVTPGTSGFTVVLKDSASNSFVAKDYPVVITYTTELDRDNFFTNVSYVTYYINNSVTLNKNNRNSTTTTRASYSISSSVSTSQQYVGNDGYKMSTTKWKTTATPGTLGRKNYNINNDVTLGSDFGDYLSVSKMKITKDGDVIYDSENNINTGGFTILDNEEQPLQLNRNGKYLFSVNFPTIKPSSSVVVEYDLSLDKDKYIEDGKPINSQMLIRNRSVVNAGSLNYNSINSSGYLKILPKISKALYTISETYSGAKTISWKINTNLSEYYDLDDLEGKTVIIRDELSEFLTYSNLSVRSLRNANSTVTLYNNTDYTVTVNDKVIEVKILNPKANPNVEITLNTNCLASVDTIENYATLIIDDEEEKIGAALDTKLYTPYVYGVIRSLGKVTYSINADKYLDGVLSNKSFLFSITQVDSSGNEVDNGYKLLSSNGTDGKVVFDGIEYSSEGSYYYKVKEVKEDEQYEYDTNEYTVKLDVAKNGEQLVVSGFTILGDKDKLEFNNTTIVENPTTDTTDNDIIDVPDTEKISIIVAIVSFTLAMSIGGYIYLKKKI